MFGGFGFCVEAPGKCRAFAVEVFAAGVGLGPCVLGLYEDAQYTSYKVVARAISNRVGVFSNRCSISRVGVVPHSCKVA